MKKIFCIIIVLFLYGCIAPYSCPYKPTCKQEIDILNQSERKILPEDIRQNPTKYLNTQVAWTGILKKVEVIDNSTQTIKFTIEHHYWDWIEDHSIQRAVAFLSPRGEGLFTFIKTPIKQDAPLPPIDSMAIVYGFPIKVDSGDGSVDLNCTFLSFAGKSWYSTDVWDYGRDYITKGDKSDFKVLKIPLK